MKKDQLEQLFNNMENLEQRLLKLENKIEELFEIVSKQTFQVKGDDLLKYLSINKKIKEIPNAEELNRLRNYAKDLENKLNN